MATCLVALGSNLGSREALVDQAMAELTVAGRVRRRSRLYRTQPVGGPSGQGEFLNAAVVVETTLEPLPLLAVLQEIEARHARQRNTRWAARTLDLDLLLYDELVVDTAELAVPHPRMSFRRFVLEPTAEVAGEMSHPTIGWTIDRLLNHLDTAADVVAVLGLAEAERRRLAATLAERLAARPIAPPPESETLSLWPSQWTTWLALDFETGPQRPAENILASDAPQAGYPVAGRPKLTIILDTDVSRPAGRPAGPLPPAWPELCRPYDRGPTLVVRTAAAEEIAAEATAALQAAWPQLCRQGPKA